MHFYLHKLDWKPHQTQQYFPSEKNNNPLKSHILLAIENILCKKKANYKNINSNFHVFIVKSPPVMDVRVKEKRKRHFQPGFK